MMLIELEENEGTGVWALADAPGNAARIRVFISSVEIRLTADEARRLIKAIAWAMGEGQ